MSRANLDAEKARTVLRHSIQLSKFRSEKPTSALTDLSNLIRYANESFNSSAH